MNKQFLLNIFKKKDIEEEDIKSETVKDKDIIDKKVEGKELKMLLLLLSFCHHPLCYYSDLVFLDLK